MKQQEKKYRVDSFTKVLEILSKNNAKKKARNYQYSFLHAKRRE